MAASAAALKLTAAYLLLLCIASDLARPALASSPPSPSDEQETAARALLRDLVEHERAEELCPPVGQRGGGGVRLGDICSPACQTCLIVCAVTCVLNKEPIACFANCTVTSSCFGKPVAALGEAVRG